MKTKQIKNTSLIILFMLLIQIILNILIPVKSIAADEIVTIQCNDINFYNALIEKLGDKIQSKNDSEKTITMTKTNIDSVESIEIDNFRQEENKITDIKGIENFINLTELDLGSNQISDLSAIAGLTNLEEVYLGYNQISDLSAISGLTNLRYLDLFENEISDLSGVSGLTNLEGVDLGYNQISDLRAISGLTNLRYLDLFENEISDLSAVSGLTNLTYLDLYNNQISDISALTGLINLEWVHLGNNQISDISAITGLTNLTYLCLFGNEISDISAITGLINLTDLDLAYNQIRDISAITGLTNLTYLDLGKNQISDISAITGLTNLTNLWLDNNQIRDISAIERLTELTKLYIYNQTIKSTINMGEIKEVELPQIIKASKDSNSKIYTEKDYILTNCTLSSNGTKIIIDTNDDTTASIQINGGKADGTIFTVYEDHTPPNVEVKHSITTPTNQDVTVTITADEEVQVVEGWILATDKKSMTKVYSSNTVTPEEVIVKDLAGNETKISVSVTNIDKVAPIGNVTYSTTEPTNQDVTVTITANEKIQQVEGWMISSDLTTLTKTFTANDKETVTITDLAGNTNSILVDVNNIDKTEIEAKVDYSTTLLTNQNVNVTITLNKKIQPVSGWTISQDGKTLSKTFEKNAEEKLTIYDEVGNSKNVTVTVKNIDKVAPIVDVKYSTTEETTEDVTVTITINEEIQPIDTWTLSKDGKSLTKTYSSNESEEITVCDLAGNKTTQEIEIKNIVKQQDDTVAPQLIPKAGEKYLICIILILSVTISIALRIKLKTFKDIK